MRHWNVEPDSVDANPRLAELVVTVPLGPEVIDVSGAVVSTGVVSTVHVRVAGEASVLPAPSVGPPLNVCEPSARPEYALGDVHAAYAPPSMRHSNVEPDSVDANPRLADAELTVPLGPEVIDVLGAVVSAVVTVQVREAGDASVLPTESVARTSNVCEPSARAL